jgi:hypothetical protein
MLSSLDPFRDDENKNNNQTTHVLNDERSLRKREEETSNNRREKLETLRTSTRTQRCRRAHLCVRLSLLHIFSDRLTAGDKREWTRGEGRSTVVYLNNVMIILVALFKQRERERKDICHSRATAAPGSSWWKCWSESTNIGRLSSSSSLGMSFVSYSLARKNFVSINSVRRQFKFTLVSSLDSCCAPLLLIPAPLQNQFSKIKKIKIKKGLCHTLGFILLSLE